MPLVAVLLMTLALVVPLALALAVALAVALAMAMAKGSPHAITMPSGFAVYFLSVLSVLKPFCNKVFQRKSFKKCTKKGILFNIICVSQNTLFCQLNSVYYLQIFLFRID